MKEKLLLKIPAEETALRTAIENSTGTRRTITRILLSSFGFNKNVWKDWQVEVESFIINSPDTDFAPPEEDTAEVQPVEEWLLGAVGKSFDTDGLHGPQCKDFANAYAKWLGFPLKPSDAAQTWDIEQSRYWQKIPYEAGAVPRTGDIVVWGPWAENSFGHIAVVLDATDRSFRSVDQNWDSEDIAKGSPAAIIEHSYTKPQILGFLRPTLT